MNEKSQEQTSMISNQLELEQYIQDILNILKKYGVSATFDYTNNQFTAEATEECLLSDKTIAEVIDILNTEVKRGTIE